MALWLLAATSVHAGFLDGIKKIGGGVAEAVGGAVDATVNVTTSAVKSVYVSPTTADEVKPGTNKHVSTSTVIASPATAIESPVANIGSSSAIQDNASYAKDRADLEERLQSFRFREDFQSIESVAEKNRIANRVNVAKSNLRRLPHKADGNASQQLRKMLDEESEIVAAVKDVINKESEERVAREKTAATAREFAVKQQAEHEAREKAEREAREKAEAEARELAAKQQAEREAREKAAREVRAKADAKVHEPATMRVSENNKDVAVPATAAATQESSGAAPESCEASTPAVNESEVSLVEWKTLFITLGIWLLIVGIGCAVAFFSKKPSADEIPQRLRKCYFINKLDYVPAMLTVPTLLVLLIGFARSDIGEIWTKILLAICGCGLLAMNWWALLKANATWGQALSLLPMRIVVGTLGLVLPVVSAIMSLAAISLAAAASKAMGEVAANVKKNNGYTRDDINKWNKAKGDMAGGAAAGALGAAGGWASKKMWGSITSRTRSLVGWEAED